MSDSIPEEIIFTEVLTRLPAKSLGRIRCVSKSWCARLGNPQFIKQHYNRRKSSNSSAVKILFGGPYQGTYKLYSSNVDKICDKNAKELIKLSPEISQRAFGHGSEILGSCNGVVCFGLLALTSPVEIILINPSTNKQWHLPPLSVYSPAEVRPSYYEYGFGYDEVSDDYKLVVLVEFVSLTFPATYETSHEIVVYSLKSDSWRKIGDLLFEASTNPNQRNAVFSGNALHWIMVDRISYDSFIVAFDLSTEQFSKLSLPEYEDNDIDMGIKLGSLDGCLSAVFHIRFDPCVEVHMWVMKNYGIKDSWTKFTLRLPNLGKWDFVTPLACLNGSSQQILLQVGRKVLLLYNLEEMSTVYERFLDEIDYCLVAYVCLDSLIQPCGGGDGDGESHRRNCQNDGEQEHENPGVG